MDLIDGLAKHVVESKYENLPPETLKTAKNMIMDILCCALAGARAPGCQVITDQIREWGGKGESAIFFYGDKVPAPNAALANGVMARALDFENAGPHGPIHINASTVPTAFAVAETQAKCGGKNILTAIVLGADIASRIAFAQNIDFLGDEGGWDPSGTCTTFGTTAVAGKLLGLNEDQMINAFGIALNQAAGTMQSNVEGAITVRLNQGLAAQRGICSALWAKNGITGVKRVLQSPWGYFHLYSRDNYDKNYLLDQLGERFEGIGATIKLYPCCRGTHGALDCILEIIRKHDIKPDNVESIRVGVSRSIYNLTGHPFKIGQNPQVDAQFSLRFVVANAVVRKQMSLEHFTEESVKSREIFSLAEKVHPEAAYEFKPGKNVLSTIVEIKTNNGETFCNEVDVPKGDPENPLSREELLQKFRDCLAFGAKPLLKNLDLLVQRVERFEEIENISALCELLSVDEN